MDILLKQADQWGGGVISAVMKRDRLNLCNQMKRWNKSKESGAIENTPNDTEMF